MVIDDNRFSSGEVCIAFNFLPKHYHRKMVLALNTETVI